MGNSGFLGHTDGRSVQPGHSLLSLGSHLLLDLRMSPQAPRISRSQWTPVSHCETCSSPCSLVSGLSICLSALRRRQGWWPTHPLSAHWMQKHLTCISSLTSPGEAGPISAPLCGGAGGGVGKQKLRGFLLRAEDVVADSGSRSQFPTGSRTRAWETSFVRPGRRLVAKGGAAAWAMGGPAAVSLA